MAVTADHTPDASTTDSSSGGSRDWTNIANVTGASNSVYATVNLDTSLFNPDNISYWAVLTDYDFNDELGSGETIDSVEWAAWARASGGSSVAMYGKCVKAGTISGNEIEFTAQGSGLYLGTSNAEWLSDNSPASLGVALSDTDVTNAGFGVAIRMENFSAGSVRTGSLDACPIAITYTAAIGGFVPYPRPRGMRGGMGGMTGGFQTKTKLAYPRKVKYVPCKGCYLQ